MARRLKGFKEGLPVKVCPRCGRPFAWRKRWRRTWEEVRYCSAACRKGKAPGRGGRGPSSGQP